MRVVRSAPLLLLLGACVPRAATSQGRETNGLYSTFTILAMIVFAIVAGLIAWSIFRFRAQPGDDGEPPQFADSRQLEVAWFVIPQLLVVGLFVITALVHSEVTAEAETPTVSIEVEAFQWGWRFTYEDLDLELVGTHEDPTQIVVPVDGPIAFTLSSPDVVHSFYVPRFLIKRDMIPGETERVDVTIEEPGVFKGVCAEFCGLLHHAMTFEVRAVPSAEFDDWVESNGGR